MSRIKRFLLFLLLIPVLLFAACMEQTIAEVKADPYRYQKKEAHIGGVVTRSFGVLNMGFYELQDNTDKILVASNRGVPAKGTKVEVKGKAINAFSFAGVSYGTVIQESDRKVHH